MNRNVKNVSIWSVLVCIGGIGVSAVAAVSVGITVAWILGILTLLSLTLLTVALAAVVEVSLRRSSKLLKKNADQHKIVQRTAGSVGRLSPIVRSAVAQIPSHNLLVAGETASSAAQNKLPDDVGGMRRHVVQPERFVAEIRRPTPDEAPKGHDTALAEMLSYQARNVSKSVETRTQFLIDLDSGVSTVQTLERSGWSSSLDISGATSLRFDLAANLRSNVKDPRAGVLWCRIYDRYGNEIESAGLSQRNDRFGSWTYIPTSISQPQNIAAPLPEHAHSVKFGIVPWKDNTILVRNAIGVTAVIATAETSEAARTPKEIRVAAILDDFSFESFRYECDMRRLEPASWRRTMQTHAPDLLLVESAWAGPDSLGSPWRGRVYASERFGYENRSTLLDILDYCSTMGIPTAFWNKEDPSHYEDKAHNFVETAVLFNHIFTTDADCVDKYTEDYGHQSVTCLPFAVQPRIYNPISTEPRENKVIFAGAWYENHVERSNDMRSMFDSVIRSSFELEIRDRFYGSDDLWHDYPSEYQEYIRPSVPHNEVAQLFKRGAIGMTINTVTESPSMFARRIFELMATNTYVVSNYSRGVEAFFGDRVLYLDREPEGLQRIDSTELTVAAERNLKEVLTAHTYEHRFAKILETCMISVQPPEATVTVVVRVDNVADTQRIRQSGFEIAQRLGYELLVLLDSKMPGSEASEAFELVNGSGCVVADERLIIDRTIDSSTLISTSHFFYCSTGIEDLESADIENYVLHSTYYSGPIVKRRAEDLPYSLRPRLGNESFFASAAAFENLGTSLSEKALVYAI